MLQKTPDIFRSLLHWFVREVKLLFTCDITHSKWGEDVIHRIFNEGEYDPHHK